MTRPYRVTAVCLGNICRSPMAEAVIRDRLERAGLADRVVVDSAGTGGWHVGRGADPRTIATLTRRGYRVDHTARQVQRSWFTDGPQRADVVVAMDAANHDELRRLAPDHAARQRIRMLRSFVPARAALAPGDPGLDVPDPYYSGDEGFDDVLDIIEEAADPLVAWLAEESAQR